MWSVYMTSWGPGSLSPEGMEMGIVTRGKTAALPKKREPGFTKSCSEIIPGEGEHCGMWWYLYKPYFSNANRLVAMRCRRGKGSRCSKYGRYGRGAFPYYGPYERGPDPYYSNVSIPERNEDGRGEETQGEILERHRQIAWRQEREPGLWMGFGGRAKKRPRRTRRGRRADKTRRSRRLRHTSRRKRLACRKTRTRRS